MEIILKDIKLMGYHGVTELERKTGTEFSIDLSIVLAGNDDLGIWNLSDTIDYTSVHDLVKTEFALTEQLLETLANRIIRKILDKYQLAQEVIITIMKTNAPIVGLDGQVGIRVKKTR